MASHAINRRDFIKGTAATGAALALSPNLVWAGSASKYDPKGIPTRELGKTGAVVPLVALGTGSRFCAVQDEEEALGILTYALDNGLYYWDTAHDYGNEEYGIISEERLGKVLRNRRNEVFLATKVYAREPDETKRHIEESLTRLQTDHVNILQMHSIESLEDAQNMEKSGMLKVVQQMKDEGVAKNIGFTGHSSAEGMKFAAKHFGADTMLCALNHYEGDHGDLEGDAVPTAAENGLGVIVMKVIRPRETVKGIDPKELIRYALSLEHVNAAVISMDSVEVVQKNIETLKQFQPMDAEQMQELRVALAPFYRHEGVEWMQPHYRDGLYRKAYRA